MSPLDLETLFANALRSHSALAAFAGLLVVEDKADSTFTMPACIVKCETTPLNLDGSVFDFAVEVFVETSADITDAREAHSTLFAAVNGALIADPADLLSAVNAQTDCDFRGWSAKAPSPGISGAHFRSAMAVAGCAVLTP